jgi:hypothetical protein
MRKNCALLTKTLEFMKVNACLVVVAAIMLNGCFPMHYTKFPGASGRVIDAETSAPIGNASIKLELNSPAKNDGPKTTLTDSNGAFSVEPVKRWGIYIVPMDFIGFFGQVSVDAPGYNSVLKELRSSPVGPEETNYGDISLERKR